MRFCLSVLHYCQLQLDTLSFSARTFTVAALGISLTPLVALVEKYIFRDWEFLGFLCVLVMVDTVLGVQRSWVTSSISSRGFSRLFTKALIYLSLLVLTHVMSTFPIHGTPNVLFQWFDYVIYSCTMAREALSILEHIAIIEPRFVPKLLLKRLALISDGGIEQALAAMPAAPEAEAAPLPTLEPVIPASEATLPL